MFPDLNESKDFRSLNAPSGSTMEGGTAHDASREVSKTHEDARKEQALEVATGDLSTLTASTQAPAFAIDAFREALARDTVEIPGKGRIIKADYEALRALAENKNNQIKLSKVLMGAGISDGGRVTTLNLHIPSSNECEWGNSPFGVVPGPNPYANKLLDLSPLAGLSHLRVLNLTNSQISDVKQLSVLTSLTELDLNHNPISDVAPLARLTALTRLSLGSTALSDVKPLAGLTALTYLFLGSNQISDVAPLAGLTALKELFVHINKISDVAPLAGLTALTTLWLQSNNISDVGPLARLTALTELWLAGNPVTQPATDIILNGFRARGSRVGI